MLYNIVFYFKLALAFEEDIHYAETNKIKD